MLKPARCEESKREHKVLLQTVVFDVTIFFFFPTNEQDKIIEMNKALTTNVV